MSCPGIFRPRPTEDLSSLRWRVFLTPSAHAEGLESVSVSRQGFESRRPQEAIFFHLQPLQVRTRKPRDVSGCQPHPQPPNILHSPQSVLSKHRSDSVTLLLKTLQEPLFVSGTEQVFPSWPMRPFMPCPCPFPVTAGQVAPSRLLLAHPSRPLDALADAARGPPLPGSLQCWKHLFHVHFFHLA